MNADETATRTVREATLETLKSLGLTTIFTNPSHTEMKLFESWPENEFRLVLGLQEAAVVGMADGYAQATGEPSFVIINGGAGLGNAMGAIYTAASARTPMVILGGQQARKLLQGEPFLNARNATQMPEPYIKWAGEPARPQDVPALLARAYHVARQVPRGPVFVSVPEDDWIRPASMRPVPRRTVEAAVVPDPAVMRQLADELNDAQRPAIVAGPTVDAQGARDDLVKLAERLQAKVYGSPVWPRGSFPETHPLFVRVLPPIPEMVAQLLGEHDVVAVLGSPAFTWFTTADLFDTAPAGPDLSELPSLPEGTRFLHVTDDADAASSSIAQTSVICPPGPAVRALVPLIRRREPSSPGSPRESAAVPEASTPLTEAYLFHRIAQVMPADAPVFEELPIARADFHEQIPLGPGNRYFATASGALGFPFAGAVGYALASPGTRVVTVVGEGSAQYSLHALWTAAQHRLPITFVIPDNAGYLSLKYYLQDQKAWQAGWDLSGLDMVSLARGFGVRAERVTNPDELNTALATAFTDDGPVLLDVTVQDPGAFRL